MKSQFTFSPKQNQSQIQEDDDEIPDKEIREQQSQEIVDKYEQIENEILEKSAESFLSSSDSGFSPH